MVCVISGFLEGASVKKLLLKIKIVIRRNLLNILKRDLISKYYGFIVKINFVPIFNPAGPKKYSYVTSSPLFYAFPFGKPDRKCLEISSDLICPIS